MTTLRKIGSTVTDWMSTFTAARSAIAEVGDAVQAKERAVADREAETGRLQSLLGPRADLESRRDVEIATLGAAWAQGRGADLLRTLSGSMVLTPTGEVEGPVFYTNIVNSVGELNLPALCFLAPELVRAGLDRLLDAAGDYDAGPPMAGRAARLRELQAEIAVLEEQHQNLVNAAGELGLTIQPLESNRVRQLMARQREQQIEHFNLVNASAIRRGTLKAAESIEEAR